MICLGIYFATFFIFFLLTFCHVLNSPVSQFVGLHGFALFKYAAEFIRKAMNTIHTLDRIKSANTTKIRVESKMIEIGSVKDFFWGEPLGQYLVASLHNIPKFIEHLRIFQMPLIKIVIIILRDFSTFPISERRKNTEIRQMGNEAWIKWAHH